jgi:hypothetical protein
MGIILYCSGTKEQRGIIPAVLKEAASGRRISVCSGRKELVKSLVGKISEIDAAVLAPAGQGELDELLDITDILSLVPCLVILPDRQKASIEKGRRLYPRYMTYMDADMGQLKAVLQRMLGKRPGKWDRR